MRKTDSRAGTRRKVEVAYFVVRELGARIHIAIISRSSPNLQTSALASSVENRYVSKTSSARYTEIYYTVTATDRTAAVTSS